MQRTDNSRYKKHTGHKTKHENEDNTVFLSKKKKVSEKSTSNAITNRINQNEEREDKIVPQCTLWNEKFARFYRLWWFPSWISETFLVGNFVSVFFSSIFNWNNLSACSFILFLLSFTTLFIAIKDIYIHNFSYFLLKHYLDNLAYNTF